MLYMENKGAKWLSEQQRLTIVLEEIRRQQNQNAYYLTRFESDSVKTQREMWQDVGAVAIANGLDQITDFMQYIQSSKTHRQNFALTQRVAAKLTKMLASPYFGRIDFLEAGESEPERCYIGISNLVSVDGHFLIYDWRAPIAGMFYDGEMGETGYDCPAGRINGRLLLKRQYKIEEGVLIYLFDSDLRIEDALLQDLLRLNTSQTMKAIVTSIQREQNQVIRNEAYPFLLVEGHAGSGKTSVALHRIAYLLYKHREHMTSQNIVIFSPNAVFSDYIANVLPELGEENMQQATFQEVMHTTLAMPFPLEGYGQMLVKVFENREEDADDMRIKSIAFKASLAFEMCLKAYAAELTTDRVQLFKDLCIDDSVIMSAEAMRSLYLDAYGRMPLVQRLDKLSARMHFLLAPYEAAATSAIAKKLEAEGGFFSQETLHRRSQALVKEKMAAVYEAIVHMTQFDLTAAYTHFIENLTNRTDYPLNNTHWDRTLLEKLSRYTLENIQANLYYYEDQLALFYLKSAVGDVRIQSGIRHVIIDEAQDYLPLQFEILKRMFEKAKMTILGDLNQSIHPFMQLGDYAHIERIFPREMTCRLHLNKCYRSTVEITTFARGILNRTDTGEYVQRHGEAVDCIKMETIEETAAKLAEAARHYGAEGYRSIGILTKTLNEAERLYAALSIKISCHAVITEEDTFVNDITVMPAYLAKGLEFDVVLIHDAGKAHYGKETDRLLLYTACTRALHVLKLYYTGELSPLLR
jgi:DNA helicase-2/ATP-dependent DNA helicase PcrA